MKILLAVAVAFCTLSTSAAFAATITFTDVDLGSGNPVTVAGTTLTTTNTGGSIQFITGGIYTGLHLGGNNTSGTYTLNFSESISSIEIEFDALSSIGTLPVETLSSFAADFAAVNISYLNQIGTTFDGSTITSIVNDGQGVITFSGGSFNAFSFLHQQGSQNGFVIERIVVNTTPSAVPLPAAAFMFAPALLGLMGIRRKMHA